MPCACFVIWASVFEANEVELERGHILPVPLQENVSFPLDGNDKVLVHEAVVLSQLHFDDDRLRVAHDTHPVPFFGPSTCPSIVFNKHKAAGYELLHHSPNKHIATSRIGAVAFPGFD